MKYDHIYFHLLFPVLPTSPEGCSSFKFMLFKNKLLSPVCGANMCSGEGHLQEHGESISGHFLTRMILPFY